MEKFTKQNPTIESTLYTILFTPKKIPLLIYFSNFFLLFAKIDSSSLEREREKSRIVSLTQVQYRFSTTQKKKRESDGRNGASPPPPPPPADPGGSSTASAWFSQRPCFPTGGATSSAPVLHPLQPFLGSVSTHYSLYIKIYFFCGF